MKRISRAGYTVEFKAAAMQQVLAGKRAADVSTERGVAEQTLHNWAKADRLGKLGEANSKAVTPQQMENSRLRAELAQTEMELEIVKKAAAYFAKESL